MYNQTIELIKKRRSHRSFSAKQITSEQLETLMDAALHSPSARDLQPWHFSFVQNKDLLMQINRAAHKQARRLDEETRSPRFSDENFDIFYQAPTVIVISSESGHYTPIDCGIAVQTIALAAESLGLGSVIVGLADLAFVSTDREKLEKALNFPEGFHFSISIAVGIAQDEKTAHPLHREKISLIV